MLKRIFNFAVAAVLLLAMSSANAQVLTVLAVSQALQSALTGLQDAVVSAGEEMKGVGNSWQHNAQDVLVDINNMLGDKMSTAVDSLDNTERKLVSDAQQLTGLMQKATTQVISHSFQEARTTLADTDILAYNTSYSLPCRSQEPRIVYWTPTRATVMGGEILVSAKGNFIYFDPDTKVLVDGVATPIIAHTERELSFAVPTSVLSSIHNESTVTIDVVGLRKRTRSSGLFAAIFGCSEKLEPALPQKLSVTLRPRIAYSIQASVGAESKSWSPPYKAYTTIPKFYRATGAGGNDDVSQNYCLKADEVVVDASMSITDKGGPSYAGPWQASGERCVYVPARVQGNGFDVFHASKGGGNIGYVLTITGKRLQVTALTEQLFQYEARSGENAIAFMFKDPPADTTLRWKYQVHVKSARGSQVLFNDTLTEVNPGSASGVSVNFKDGTMSVTLPGETPWTEL